MGGSEDDVDDAVGDHDELFGGAAVEPAGGFGGGEGHLFDGFAGGVGGHFEHKACFAVEANGELHGAFHEIFLLPAGPGSVADGFGVGVEGVPQPISSLVKRATARAIDEAIIKLQNNHEEFRTVLPIIGGDGQNIYAAIGTKEGLNEKDEYEILQPTEDEKGHKSYKSIGTVKAVKGKIMDNAYGAADDLADAKLSDEAKEAINRKYSEFKGKKGDFTGMFLRLKKKK